MRRRSTILSLLGLVILVLLLTGLGLTIWRQGGLTFSPGNLSANNRLETLYTLRKRSRSARWGRVSF